MEDDEKGKDNVLTLGGSQEMLTVNESGLYALIFRSRKPSARLFRRWVTNEVLPALRRTGGYVAAPTAALEVVAAPLPPLLPPVPKLDGYLASIFCGVCGFGTPHRLATAADIASVAAHHQLFPDLCTDPTDALQIARLLRFIQGRGFLCRWLEAPNGKFYAYAEAVGAGRCRRYSVTVRKAVGL